MGGFAVFLNIRTRHRQGALPLSFWMKKKNVACVMQCDLNYATLAYISALHSTHTPICLFPCLGLELNFKTRYFFPSTVPILFFLPRDNAAPPQSAGSLSISFECSSKYQAEDSSYTPPPPWLCKYSMSYCPHPVDRRAPRLGNFIFNGGGGGVSRQI